MPAAAPQLPPRGPILLEQSNTCRAFGTGAFGGHLERHDGELRGFIGDEPHQGRGARSIVTRLQRSTQTGIPRLDGGPAIAMPRRERRIDGRQLLAACVALGCDQ